MTEYAPLEPARYIEEEPTPVLRFVPRGVYRILQQRWKITHYVGASIDSRVEEWRDVPLEDEAEDHPGDSP